ncbi:membrane-associated phospholipid phosphatase [Kitasatospora sp. MAP12-15]|uniref:phosphatase PAP2 family protein n=1 Tax=unclassified Kitasatospora TaxID=2633591 RepID=UPI0024747665|nr:hypothetical protein [Kitasatospora sp. MAP12-44]MDH6112058.1 membrane-associated phospholipid phosphatase [Kitasatospora sp. MAP12-44]
MTAPAHPVEPRPSEPAEPAEAAESRPARLITDGLEPKNWIILVTLLMGWHAQRLVGVGWGVEAALFCGVIPIVLIKLGERRGHWGDRHVRRRQDRLVVIPMIMASVVCGMALMLLCHAPREMAALVAAMLAALVVILAITVFWKVSVHTAVSSGAIAMLALTYGPWMLALYPLVAVVGWSRVELKDHTLAQVLVGTVLGAAVAAATFLALR